MSNSTIQTLGIVGTGAMGRGIAQIAAQAGLTVNLYDTNAQAVAAARQYLAWETGLIAQLDAQELATFRFPQHD